ncbi:MAG: NAD-dependent epimerase/dehydratase family protein [Candidatus Omnitrophica bacterium]|nr:NAD-dependent epimerase/dehydratase family protein [Candidatus Omnitrophota bacterium]
MKALVTGGSGFIGSHVVDKLRDKGIEVRVYDGIMPTYRKDIEYYQGSILDITSLGFAMHGIDAVFHLAAVADVKDVYNDPYRSESINVRGTINVLEAARNAGVKRIIYGSTTWVYSEATQNQVDETTPLHAPTHLYTATKLTGEYYCQSYSKLYGMDVTILRYGIPYGPRARDGAVIPIFVRKATNGEPLTIAGDGMQFRKFIYVEDLAEGNVLALKEIGKNKIYNLDGKEKVTIKQIAETVKKILGDVKIEFTPARPGDFSGKEVSSDLAKKELGWEPKISFEEGVRRYIKWYKEREEKRKADWDKTDEVLKK